MTSRFARILVVPALLVSSAGLAQNPNQTRHNEYMVARLRAEMASDKLSSEQLTQYYIDRIQLTGSGSQ